MGTVADRVARTNPKAKKKKEAKEPRAKKSKEQLRVARNASAKKRRADRKEKAKADGPEAVKGLSRTYIKQPVRYGSRAPKLLRVKNSDPPRYYWTGSENKPKETEYRKFMTAFMQNERNKAAYGKGLMKAGADKWQKTRRIREAQARGDDGPEGGTWRGGIN